MSSVLDLRGIERDWLAGGPRHPVAWCSCHVANLGSDWRRWSSGWSLFLEHVYDVSFSASPLLRKSCNFERELVVIASVLVSVVLATLREHSAATKFLVTF